MFYFRVVLYYTHRSEDEQKTRNPLVFRSKLLQQQAKKQIAKFFSIYCGKFKKKRVAICV